MRTLFITLLFLLTPSLLYAQPSPGVSVWATPAQAPAGETVTLSALVYNTQTQTVTVRISFSTVEKTLGEPVVLTIAPATAKTASVAVVQPGDRQLVTVTTLSAIGADKKPVPTLEGVLGTITIGPEKKDILNDLSGVEATLMRTFRTTRAHIETFRLKQALHFTTLRDNTRALIDANETPVDPTTEEAPTTMLDTYKTAAITQYTTLGTATILAAFFSKMILFYIVSFLLLFGLIRFVFRTFV